MLAKSLNKTEIIEATRLCAKANASITVNYSPWAYFWGGQPGLNAKENRPRKPNTPRYRVPARHAVCV